MNGLRRAAAFAAGLMLLVGAMLAAVLLPALNESLFERALIKHVTADGLSGAEDAQALRRFAKDTIGYLRGDAPEWSPEVALGGASIPVSAAFASHMADIRRAASAATLACAACLLIGAALTALAWSGGRGNQGDGFDERPFADAAVRANTRLRSRRLTRAYLVGAALPLLAVLALGLWAALDFNGFWGWLHRAFIPGGIFAADEPVMRLFPLALFGEYLAPVAAIFACGLALVAAFPVALRRLADR